MKLRASLVALSILALLPAASGSFAAETPNLLYGPYSSRGYELQERQYRRLAEGGVGEAQYWMGFLYERSSFPKCDIRTALDWYRKSAARNYAPAYYALAEKYQLAIGVRRDLRKAFELFERGAELGDATAQRALGEMYFAGSGTQKDDDLAALWMKQAAATLDPLAMADLALFYLDGTGVERSYEKALFLSMQAVGHPVVTISRGSELKYRLALLYLDGRGVGKDEAEAFRLMKSAAAPTPYAPALWQLARFYEQGIGVEQNAGLAGAWRKKAETHYKEHASTPPPSDASRDPCRIVDEGSRVDTIPAE